MFLTEVGWQSTAKRSRRNQTDGDSDDGNIKNTERVFYDKSNREMSKNTKGTQEID
ncbi:hypothetical protein [Chelatococcus sp.]|uniref:hypothetical protein n=1 Tax=Chelatococcus sp. TaxID=1953771 RepID=UPI0025BA1E28|nr:hypothetical protein [Chelatococcus sp.]